MTYAVDLPDMPPGHTPNSRDHWAHRHRAVAEWRDAAAWTVRAAGVPAMDRVAVELVVTPPDRRRRDADSAMWVLKAAIDGMCDAGVLADDDRTRVPHVAVRWLDPDGSRRWRWRLEIRDVSREGAA